MKETGSNPATGRTHWTSRLIYISSLLTSRDEMRWGEVKQILIIAGLTSLSHLSPGGCYDIWSGVWSAGLQDMLLLSCWYLICDAQHVAWLLLSTLRRPGAFTRILQWHLLSPLQSTPGLHWTGLGVVALTGTTECPVLSTPQSPQRRPPQRLWK